MKIFGMDLFSVSLLIIVLLLAIIPARIAKGKGYSFGGFYAFGAFFFPIALIVSLLMNPKHTANDLLAYKQLLDQGAITKAEFEQKKHDIMGN